MSLWQGRRVDLADAADGALSLGLSRRQVLRRGAVAAGVAGSLGALDVPSAFAWWGAQPRPIPGGFDQNFNPVPKDPFIHLLPPAIGYEMSTITDFRGTVVAGETQGKARGSDGTRYAFDTDMRFMEGEYVGRDGRRRWGSFGFV